MSFGASLAWNNFWTKFCFINGFRRLKNTIKHYIVAENEENLSSCFRENSKYIMLDYFSLILKKPLEQILRKRCY